MGVVRSSLLVVSFLLIFRFGIGDHASNGFFELDAVKCHISAAAFTYDAYVAADAKNVKKLSSARVGLFQFKHVSDRYFNDLQSKSLQSA